MRPTALITGASSGIGLELARIHAARGGDLVIVARRGEELEVLAGQLRSAHGTDVVVIAQDLALPSAARDLYKNVQDRGIEIDFLINNAGFGGHGLFYERDLARERAMIQLNVITLVELTHLFLTGFVARGSGRVLNVASMAGFIPGPLQAVYYATKAFVLSFSEAIANELEDSGVTVTALAPGAVATGFAEVADVGDLRAWERSVASPKDVAAYGYQAMLDGKVVAVPGFANRFLIHFVRRLIPRGIVTRISRMTMERT